jgi:hypothetical protein
LRLDLIVQLIVVTLETVRIRHRLCIATGGILRALANAIDVVLRFGGGRVGLALRLERFVELRTCGRGDERRHHDGGQDGQPVAGSSSYL